MTQRTIRATPVKTILAKATPIRETRAKAGLVKAGLVKATPGRAILGRVNLGRASQAQTMTADHYSDEESPVPPGSLFNWDRATR